MQHFWTPTLQSIHITQQACGDGKGPRGDGKDHPNSPGRPLLSTKCHRRHLSLPTPSRGTGTCCLPCCLTSSMGITWAYPPPAAPPAQQSIWSHQTCTSFGKKPPPLNTQSETYSVDDIFLSIFISIRGSMMQPNKQDFPKPCWLFSAGRKRGILDLKWKPTHDGWPRVWLHKGHPLFLPWFRTWSCTCSCWEERCSSHEQALLLNEIFTPLPEHSFPAAFHGTGKGVHCSLHASWVEGLKHSHAPVLAEKHQATGAFQLKSNLLT